MTAPIIVTPAKRAPTRDRRGSALGIGAFLLSVITGFWAIVLWAVSIGATEPGSGRPIAIVFFTFCAIIGFVFFALTAVAVTFSFRRNVRLGRIWATLGAALALAALAAGVFLAVAVAAA